MSLFTAMSVPADINMQPKFDWSSPSVLYSLYYIVFMFVASLCSIQLFIGVILEIFKRKSGISSLTNTQRQFQDLQRQLALIKPTRRVKRPSGSWFRGKCYDMVIDKRGKFAKCMAYILSANIGEQKNFSVDLRKWWWLADIDNIFFFSSCLCSIPSSSIWNVYKDTSWIDLVTVGCLRSRDLLENQWARSAKGTKKRENMESIFWYLQLNTLESGARRNGISTKLLWRP